MAWNIDLKQLRMNYDCFMMLYTFFFGTSMVLYVYVDTYQEIAIKLQVKKRNTLNIGEWLERICTNCQWVSPVVRLSVLTRMSAAPNWMQHSHGNSLWWKLVNSSCHFHNHHKQSGQSSSCDCKNTLFHQLRVSTSQTNLQFISKAKWPLSWMSKPWVCN